MRNLIGITVLLAAGLMTACGEAPTQAEYVGLTFKADAATPLTLTGVLFLAAPEAGATGLVTLRCVNQGTLITAHFTGLLPKGVYTIWLFSTTARGAAGPNDGSANWFRASQSGEGQLSLLVSPDDVGSFAPGTLPWPSCLDASTLRKPAPALILDGHTDGMTNGGVPFPNNYDAMKFLNP